MSMEEMKLKTRINIMNVEAGRLRDDLAEALVTIEGMKNMLAMQESQIKQMVADRQKQDARFKEWLSKSGPEKAAQLDTDPKT